MLWANPVDHALSNLKKHVRAPVRVVLWDGREVALSGPSHSKGVLTPAGFSYSIATWI